MADNRASWIWVDANGVTRQTIITTLAADVAIATALQAASQSGVDTFWASSLGSSIGSAAVGNYQSVKMAARLLFQTAAGNILRLTLVAPQIGIFLADGQTIDPTNPLVTAITGAAIGALSDGAGNAATGFLGGVLEPSRNDLPPIA